MNRIVSTLILLCLPLFALCNDAIHNLMERLSPGLSQKINIYIEPDDNDYFIIFQDFDKPAIKANSTISAATGLNHYLKYIASTQMCWNDLTPYITDPLPDVSISTHRSTNLAQRYYLNYCTHSYSMAFWDWERWQQEIDWMALHGINMPLVITGINTVWRNTLRRLETNENMINRFIAGKGYEAWWLMGNLEGMGGPPSEYQYDQDAELQKKIITRMRQLGMHPVVPGYAGMIPHDLFQENGKNKYDSGRWCGYDRPGFISPCDSLFDIVADIYYDELTRLYGSCDYYSMDPFHEGNVPQGTDLSVAGSKIYGAMKRCNPDAVWIAQGWQYNPQPDLIRNIPKGDITILDLQAENQPQWQANQTQWNNHNWLYCMLLNFGGNVGMHGKLSAMTDGFLKAKSESPAIRGIGLTMEGIDNNPVAYELVCELPWVDSIDIDNWLSQYATARYGYHDDRIDKAWKLLKETVYGCPDSIVQQGCRESIFCAQPSDHPTQVSSWASTKYTYDHHKLLQAANSFCDVALRHGANANMLYDLVDITRQAVADRARELIDSLYNDILSDDLDKYKTHSTHFMTLLYQQDKLLGSIPDFRVGKWTESARACDIDSTQQNMLEQNARRLISSWGYRQASINGGLHDYAHREWQGILRDLYARRWQAWFDAKIKNWGSDNLPDIDFYTINEEWIQSPTRYSAAPEGDPLKLTLETLSILGVVPEHPAIRVENL